MTTRILLIKYSDFPMFKHELDSPQRKQNLWIYVSDLLSYSQTIHNLRSDKLGKIYDYTKI